MKPKPDRPPSAVAEVPYQALDFKQSFRALRQNLNFFLLAVAFALPFGAFLAIGTLMSNIFDPFGYKPAELSSIALMLLGSGVVGAIITGLIIDKTGAYKSTMHVVTFMTGVSTWMLIVTLTWFTANQSMFLGWCETLGFFATGFIPLSLSFGAELTFPLQPALVNGTLTLLGSMSGFVFSMIGAYMNTEGKDDHLLSDDELVYVKQLRSKTVLGVLATASMISFVLSLVIKEDLRRLRYSEKHKNRHLRHVSETTGENVGNTAYNSGE